VSFLSQGPAFIAATVTAILGVPEHSVRVITRRVGGAFGGKVSRAAPIAAAAALAARKFNRPVRLTLDRNTDMKMTGGREPIVGDYEVGFTEEGKITSLRVKVRRARIYPQRSCMHEFIPSILPWIFR
jgi:xanthine dehydrogenase molybdopterin-binding subunit B